MRQSSAVICSTMLLPMISKIVSKHCLFCLRVFSPVLLLFFLSKAKSLNTCFHGVEIVSPLALAFFSSLMIVRQRFTLLLIAKLSPVSSTMLLILSSTYFSTLFNARAVCLISSEGLVLSAMIGISSLSTLQSS